MNARIEYLNQEIKKELVKIAECKHSYDNGTLIATETIKTLVPFAMALDSYEEPAFQTTQKLMKTCAKCGYQQKEI